MNPLSPARKASLGMTAVLGIAVAAGAAFALFNAHAAPATALRPELPNREATSQAPAAADDDDERTALSGSVLETFGASSYTYLRLSTANGEIWAAVPSTSVAVGARVTVENATKMTAFKSATLKRTFDVIYFGTLGTGAAKAAAPRFSPADALDNEDDQDLPPGHPDIGGSAPGSMASSDSLPSGHPSVDGASASPHGASPSAPGSALPAVAVPPARGSNGRTIAQLSSESAKLAGQKIRVRGQVTKVTAGVQGHTFFHLRDGKPTDGEPGSDLVVTSNATPERGQIATFEGTVRTNVDIGIGYSYPILLENAELVAE
ncbi:MAG TPA: hypothetical protein VER11_31900 [Polyangiaceae bacterium]|nr:hypothetical protein [Polyangiaceae bacterium]